MESWFFGRSWNFSTDYSRSLWEIPVSRTETRWSQIISNKQLMKRDLKIEARKRLKANSYFTKIIQLTFAPWHNQFQSKVINNKKQWNLWAASLHSSEMTSNFVAENSSNWILDDRFTERRWDKQACSSFNSLVQLESFHLLLLSEQSCLQ